MSEIKDRVLLKKYEEFMSRKCNFDDFIRLRANKVHQGMTLEFGALSLFFRVDGKLFLQHGNITLKTIDNPTRKQVDEIYHFFTGEHLDFMSTKVYNWENCFSRGGWYICDDNDIISYIGDSKDIEDYPKQLYPNQEDAESALAHCQLLHIINKINEDYPIVDDCYLIYATIKGSIHFTDIDQEELFYGLLANSKEAAKVLIRDNEQLLKTYFKIK